MLPSLRLRKREQRRVPRLVRRITEAQVLELRIRERPGHQVLRRMREAANCVLEARTISGPSLLHLPKDLAEKILTSRSALEGERKQLTALFADVKGSMDPEPVLPGSDSVKPENDQRILFGH